MFYNTAAASRILRTQTLQYTGNQTSVPSTAFQSQTRQVQIAAQVAGFIAIGENNATTASASSSGTIITTTFPLVFMVTPGQNVAYISTSTSSGAISVTELGA